MTEANSLNSTAISRRSLIARSAALAAVPVAAPVAVAMLAPADRDAETEALIQEAYGKVLATIAAVNDELALEAAGYADDAPKQAKEAYNRACERATFMERQYEAFADRIVYDRDVQTWRDVVLLAVVCCGYSKLGANSMADDPEDEPYSGDRALGHLMHAAMAMGSIKWPEQTRHYPPEA